MNFNSNVNDVLAKLMNSDHVTMVTVNPKIEEFKEFVIGYVKEHDGLENNDPIIGQIKNFNTVDEIEKILRASLEYCDECMIKLFRKYTSGDVNEPSGGCGCGGE